MFGVQSAPTVYEWMSVKRLQGKERCNFNKYNIEKYVKKISKNAKDYKLKKKSDQINQAEVNTKSLFRISRLKYFRAKFSLCKEGSTTHIRSISARRP